MRGEGVFRRRHAVRSELEKSAATLSRRGRSAARAGHFELAAQAQQSAAARIRRLSDDQQDDPRHARTLAAILYDLAEALIRTGRPEDAVPALDEAEDAYRQLRDGADGIADVRARRALAYGLSGAGASAIVDVQSAVLHYRAAVADPDDPRQRDLARVLAANADVLAGYGDPDLAVASADLAVRTYLGLAGPDVTELRRALGVAIAVHGAHGRHDLADQAGTVARRSGGLAGGPTVLGERQRVARPPQLAVTVATALDAARQRLGRQPPRIGDRAVVRPAVDVELLVPLDRVLVPLGAGGRSADAAARLGGTFAALARELTPLDADRGQRLAFEAHALLAGASRLESEALRYQLPRLGPVWAEVLVTASRRAETHRDPALAMDLAAWAGGVAEQLFPATLVDREARTVAVDVLDHHGRLLAQRGDDLRARDAAKAAARLRAMP